MSKAHRGSGVLELVNKGRNTCPVCKRSGVKTVYEYEAGGKKLMICKQCKAAIAHGKKGEALVSQ